MHNWSKANSAFDKLSAEFARRLRVPSACSIHQTAFRKR